MAEDIVRFTPNVDRATIDLDANSADEIRNLPPGSPTVHAAAHAVFADEDGRLYIRGDYRWSRADDFPTSVSIRRLPDTRLVIETMPRRVSVQDPTQCFERWYGEYLFQVVDTDESVEP